jgi:hypothetical protein
MQDNENQAANMVKHRSQQPYRVILSSWIATALFMKYSNLSCHWDSSCAPTHPHLLISYGMTQQAVQTAMTEARVILYLPISLSTSYATASQLTNWPCWMRRACGSQKASELVRRADGKTDKRGFGEEVGKMSGFDSESALGARQCVVSTYCRTLANWQPGYRMRHWRMKMSRLHDQCWVMQEFWRLVSHERWFDKLPKHKLLR